MVEVVSHLTSVCSPDTVSCLGSQYQAQILSCWGQVQIDCSWLLQRQKCHYCTFGSILPVHPLLWFLGFTSGWDYWLCFYFSSLHSITSDTNILRTTSQEGNFQVCSTPFFQGVSQVCGVFDNKVLSASSWRQAKAMAILYIVWGVPWTSFAACGGYYKDPQLSKMCRGMHQMIQYTKWYLYKPTPIPKTQKSHRRRKRKTVKIPRIRIPTTRICNMYAASMKSQLNCLNKIYMTVTPENMVTRTGEMSQNSS